MFKQTDIERAWQLMTENKDTLTLVSQNEIIEFHDRGITPLLTCYKKAKEEKKEYSAFCASDRVIGKGAAFLYVLLQIREVRCIVISKPALQVLNAYKIKVQYEVLTDMILNRKKDGFCPMESAVLDVDKPELAISKIMKAYEALKS